MDFSKLEVSDIDIFQMEHLTKITRRGKFLHFYVCFTANEKQFLYEIKVGKKGKWTGLGFRHDGYSYRNVCPHCSTFSYSHPYCSKFSKFQNKLVKTLLNHDVTIKEIKKVRLRFLTDFGINITKKR